MQIASKIGFRLSIGFLVILLILVSVTLFSISKMNVLSEQTENMYKHPLTVSNAVLRINANIIKIHRAMKDLTLSDGKEHIEDDAKLVDELEAEVHQDFEIINERFLGKAETYKYALSVFNEWKPIRDEVINLMFDGQVKKAVDITKGKGARHVEKIERAMEALGNFAQGKAKEFLSSATHTKELSFNTMYFILVVAVLLSIIFAIYITLSITNPISTIRETIEAIGEGELKANIRLKTQDELGELANTFNTMMRKLSEITASRDELDNEVEERRITEEALRESKESYKALLHYSPIAISVTKKSGEIEYINSRFTEVLGYVIDDIKYPEQWWSKAYPDEKYREEVIARWTEATKEALKLGRDITSDTYNVTCKNGTVIIMEIWGVSISDKLMLFCHDITKHKEAEAELLSVSNKLSRAAKSAHVGNWEWDLADYSVIWSDEMYRIFGLEIGTPPPNQEEFRNLVHEDYQYICDSDVITANLSKNEFEQNYDIIDQRTSEIKHVHNLAIVEHNPKGNAVKVFGTLQDITKRKAIEDSLRLSQELLSKSQEIGHIGSWHLDIKKNILKWSDEQYRIFGHTPQSFGATYEAFLDTIHPDDKDMVNKVYTEAIENNTPYECVHRILRPNGEIRIVLEKSEDIVDDKGKALHSFGITHDITEQKTYEQKLSKSLSEKEILLKEIHHRVKNNLAVIQSLLSLQSSQARDVSAKYALDESQSRVRAMSMIHERLYKSSDLSTIDFAEYITNLSKQLYENYCIRKKDITLEVNIQRVSIDIDTIIPCGLIVNELVTNSFKYAFPDSRSGVVYVGCEYDFADQMHLIVRDSGVGLPEGFDFSTSDSLGMKIVHSLSNQIGSEVVIRSDEKGTEFRILLLKATVPTLEWDDELYLLGHEIIDKQHKRLFDAINELRYSIESGQYEEGVSIVIPELLRYADVHFKAEEAIMRKCSYFDYESHKKHHSDFLRKTGEFASDKNDDNKRLSYVIYDTLIEWLIDHIANIDKKFVNFMKEEALLAEGNSITEAQQLQKKHYNVLTIEDDRLAQMTLGRFLQKNGYDYQSASSGIEAIKAANINTFELIISDIMLPDIDGIATITHLRKAGIVAPVVFLTGEDENKIAEQVKGLNVLGILSKPLSFSNLKKVLSEFFER